MQTRILSRLHLVRTLLSVCILVGVLTAFQVNAQGLLPSRHRYRAQALIAGRHYRRQFSNETGEDSSPDDGRFTAPSIFATPSGFNDPSAQSIVNGPRNNTGNGQQIAGLGAPALVSSSTTTSIGKSLPCSTVLA
jgi:hypothetical protein